MKILSSFDTEFKNKIYNREVEKYGKENVYIISHGRFYYYFYIITPIVSLGVVSLFLLGILIYFSYSSNESLWIWLIGLIVFIITILPIIFKLIKKYVDYILDFVVVTPNELISYDQEGILSRKGRTVDTEKIKTITVNKSGLLRSMFNFGNIIVLTEGDEQGSGEINFSFIDNPDEVKFKLLEIIDKKDS